MYSIRILAFLTACASIAAARPLPQIGGDAQACYSILNNVDNGSGYAIENIEDNIADLLSGQNTGSDSEQGSNGSNTGGGQGPPPAAPAPKPPRRSLTLTRRQLNKVVAGLGNLGDATKTSNIIDPIVTVGDDIDTLGTNGQGQIGKNIGDIEDPIIPEIANAITNLNPRSESDA